MLMQLLQRDRTRLSVTKLHAARWFPEFTLLLWVLPLILMQSQQQSLLPHDEGIYATQARAIWQTGDWLAPQWGEVVQFDRTIGIQWLIALCYGLFGVSEGSVRLPSQIAFVLSVLLLYRIGLIISKRRPFAWLGAAIFALMPVSVQYARLGTQDSVLVCLELLGIGAMLAAEQSSTASSVSTVKARPSPYLLLTGATLGWGFMIKGFMIIPAAIALLPYLVGQQRRHHHLGNPWLYAGLVVGCLPVVGWIWAATQQYGMLPIDGLFGKLLHLRQQTYQGAGPFYYWWNIPANGFPWVLLGLAGLVVGLTNPVYRQQLQPYRLLVFGFPLLLLIELNLFGTKTHYYPLQLLPWFALLAAIALERFLQGYPQRRSRGLAIVSYSLGSVGIILVLLTGAALLQQLPLPAGIHARNLGAIASVMLVLGLGWIGLLGIWVMRRPLHQWLIGLLLPPWLALGLLGLTGVWGNYNSTLKTFLQQPPIQQVLQHQTIDFIVQPEPLSRRGRKQYLLLSFYTPHVGRYGSQWRPTAAAWVDPNLAQQMPAGYQTIGEFDGWRLVVQQQPTGPAALN
jgi:4-amino-4-deoxy-L-arabinose transferase-like glycosyltransferase